MADPSAPGSINWPQSVIADLPASTSSPLTNCARQCTLGLGSRFQLPARRWWWTGRAAILTNTPEMNSHQQRSRQGQQDHMSYIEPDQRGLAYCCATNKHAVHRVAQDRRIWRQVGAYSNSPDSDLVPRQEIAGEAQEQGYKEKSNAYDPVKLSGRLVRAMIKDANHV